MQKIWEDSKDNEKYMRSCLCKLAISLYLDHQPFEHVQRPSFCRIYDALEKENPKPQQEFQNLDQYQEMLNALNKYFSAIDSEIEKCLKGGDSS